MVKVSRPKKANSEKNPSATLFYCLVEKKKRWFFVLLHHSSLMDQFRQKVHTDWAEATFWFFRILPLIFFNFENLFANLFHRIFHYFFCLIFRDFFGDFIQHQFGISFQFYRFFEIIFRDFSFTFLTFDFFSKFNYFSWCFIIYFYNFSDFMVLFSWKKYCFCCRCEYVTKS